MEYKVIHEVDHDHEHDENTKESHPQTKQNFPAKQKDHKDSSDCQSEQN